MPEITETDKDKFTDAEIVAQIARELIPTYHPEIASANMRFVFQVKPSLKNGRPVLGTVRKISGVVHYLLEIDFLVIVALECFNVLSAEQRRALVDHLLERCTGEENDQDAGAPIKWKIREPDVQEFSSILGRYGAWNDGLVAFQNAMQQGVDLEAIAHGETQVQGAA